MRVPGVDVEEELLFVVFFEPVAGLGHRTCRATVGLFAPICDNISGLVVADLGGARAGAFLTEDCEVRLETAVVVHSAAGVEGCIDDGCGVDTLVAKDLRKGDRVVGQRIPSHE